MKPRSQSEAAPPRARAAWGPALLLILAVALVYANSLRAPFLFDDQGAVVGNPTIRRLFSIEVLRPPADGSTTTGRPIVNLSFALNHALGGESVAGYHALNGAIHAGAALFLMGLVRRTLRLPRLAAPFGSAAAGLGFVAALLWALHPLQTETVVCVAQRTEALCGFFYLGTLYGFVRAVGPAETAARIRPGAWLVFSGLLCLLGMGTKEVMVTAPLVVWLYDRTWVAGGFAAAWRARRFYHASLAATWIWLGWLVTQGGGARGVAAGFGLGVSPWTYLLTQCEAILLYLKLALWPHPLVLDYGTAVVGSAASVWWQGLLVLAGLAATGWAVWRRPAAGFFGAWFFLLLAPSSSFVPLVTQTIAEHRMYLPLAGVIVAGVVAGYAGLGRRAVWGGLALALVLGVLTVVRNQDYRDGVTIWSASVRDFPRSARAHNNLAWALQQRGRTAEALVHYTRAVELDPAYATAHYNRGVVLLGQQRGDDAMRAFEQALRFVPEHADARVNLGIALVRAGRAVEAIPHLERAVARHPAADAHYNLGIALLEAGRTTDADRQFTAALELNPGLGAAHFQLGRAAERAGRAVEAEARYRAAVRVSPDLATAQARLGLLLARAERFAEAESHLRTAVRLQPDDADAQANLGNVLLMQDRPREALACYEEALRLRPNDPRTQENIRLAREALR